MQIDSTKIDLQEVYVGKGLRQLCNLAETTSYLWENRLAKIKSNKASFDDFKNIVLYFVSVQIPVGIELQTSIEQ